MCYNIQGKIIECWLVETEGIFLLIFLSTQGPFSNFSSGGREGGFEKQTSKMGQLQGGGGGESGDMLPRIILILTPLKCREMHFKLTNAGIP